jgi:DME family drug/metabolite transporter
MCGDLAPSGGGDHRRFRPSAALLVVAAAMLWGTTGTARQLGPDGPSALAVGAMRVAVGGGILLVLAARRRMRMHGWAPVPTALAVGAMAAYQPLFFGGVSQAGVAVGTVVGIGTSPIAGGILGRLVRNERLGGHWVLATVLGIAGAVLLATGAGDEGGSAVGLLLAIGAGVSYAIYVAASARLLDDHSPEDVAAVALGGAAVVLLPVALVAGVGWVTEPGGLAMAAWLGVATVAVAYPLLAAGLAKVGVAATATLTLAEPATAAVLGLTLLGEEIESVGWLGLALVAAGVAVEAHRVRNQR